MEDIVGRVLKKCMPNMDKIGKNKLESWQLDEDDDEEDERCPRCRKTAQTFYHTFPGGQSYMRCRNPKCTGYGKIVKE